MKKGCDGCCDLELLCCIVLWLICTNDLQYLGHAVYDWLVSWGDGAWGLFAVLVIIQSNKSIFETFHVARQPTFQIASNTVRASVDLATIANETCSFFLSFFLFYNLSFAILPYCDLWCMACILIYTSSMCWHLPHTGCTDLCDCLINMRPIPSQSKSTIWNWALFNYFIKHPWTQHVFLSGEVNLAVRSHNQCTLQHTSCHHVPISSPYSIVSILLHCINKSFNEW